MSLTLTDKSKIQIYANEFIAHNILNRALLRLYDNDLIVYNSLYTTTNAISAELQLEIDGLDVRVSTNEALIDNLNLSGIYTLINASSANWEWTYNKVNANYSSWDSVYSTVNATSAVWDIGGSGGGSSTFSGLIDTDANPTFLTNGDQLQWSDASKKWIAYTPTTGTYTTAGEVSSIVETYDITRDWTSHGNNSITDRRHLTDDWRDALTFGPTVLNSTNTVVAKNDILSLVNINNMVRAGDIKPSGQDAGDFLAGGPRKRVINTELNNTITGAQVSGNNILLPSGNFFIDAEVTAHEVGAHKAWVYEENTGIYLLSGNVAYNSGSACVKGLFSTTTMGNIQIRHECTTSVTTSGLGLACGFGDPEKYLDITIFKFDESV